MSEFQCQPESSHSTGGHYVEDRAGAPFDCVAPATGDVISRLHEATPAITLKAVQSAA